MKTLMKILDVLFNPMILFCIVFVILSYKNAVLHRTTYGNVEMLAAMILMLAYRIIKEFHKLNTRLTDIEAKLDKKP